MVGVTSGPGAVADKSCVAAQLASVLAGPGKARVLLMEANFDRPSVHRLMRIDMPFSQFRAQVIPYLEPDLQSLHDSSQTFDRMRDVVLDELGRLGT